MNGESGHVSGGRRSWFPRASKVVLVLAVLAVIFGVYFWRYQKFRSGLRFYTAAQGPGFAAREFPFLSRDEAVLVGTAHAAGDRPLSSYTLFPVDKPDGVVRVGVFGCSFVRGSEAPEGFDSLPLAKSDPSVLGCSDPGEERVESASSTPKACWWPVAGGQEALLGPAQE